MLKNKKGVQFMMDYRTMEPEVKMPRKSLKKEIYIIQGNLDDIKLQEIEMTAEEGSYILVTGNVILNNRKSVVRCGLVVLGDCYLYRPSIFGDLYVYGQLHAEGPILHSNIYVREDAVVGQETFLVGERFDI